MQKKKLIYIASPYSGTTWEQEYRYDAVSQYAASCILAGEAAISPIAYGHGMVNNNGVAPGWREWMDFDEQLLIRCDEVRVLCLPGWLASEGVRHEIAIATDHDIPIEFVDYESYERF